jgi:hypothetical protein
VITLLSEVSAWRQSTSPSETFDMSHLLLVRKTCSAPSPPSRRTCVTWPYSTIRERGILTPLFWSRPGGAREAKTALGSLFFVQIDKSLKCFPYLKWRHKASVNGDPPPPEETGSYISTLRQHRTTRGARLTPSGRSFGQHVKPRSSIPVQECFEFRQIQILHIVH